MFFAFNDEVLRKFGLERFGVFEGFTEILYRKDRHGCEFIIIYSKEILSFRI